MSLFHAGAASILLAYQATLLGVVRDAATGEPLAQVTVSLPDLNRATVTGPDGRYRLADVPAGPQHVAIRLLGYEPRTLHALVPPSGSLVVDVALHVVPVRLARVEVRPRLAMRSVEPGDATRFPDRGVSIAAVRNHPLLSEPDALQALGGGEVVLRPESPSGVHVRGAGSDQLVFLLDGVPVLSPYHAAGMFSAWNPDALDGLELASAVPAAAHPAALGGAVAATTRAPGAQMAARGGISTTQTRVTVDGPLGAGTGVLLSLRLGHPGMPTTSGEPSYLHGETGDWMAKLETGAFGGRVRLLAYDSENEISAASRPDGGSDRAVTAPRNAFEWESGSRGAEWMGDLAGLSVRLLAWRAVGATRARWAPGNGGAALGGSRRDEGAIASVRREAHSVRTEAGLRLERSRTSYRAVPESAGVAPFVSLARTSLATAYVEHSLPLWDRLHVEIGGTLTTIAGRVHPGPRGRVRWAPHERLSLTGSSARLYQFAQSLRNAESVVGNIFPADLYLGAGDAVPVARGHLHVLAAEYHPAAGARIGVQAYVRDADGVLLVAAREGEPFATNAPLAGRSRARGASADLAVSGARYGIVASYGVQRVRLHGGASAYVPDHGATHLLEGGVIVFPSTTTSLRLGATAIAGRRTTVAAGGLEWESCNLLDEGCEFGGSPRSDAGALGASRPPLYLRVDLGLRKHWHFPSRGRQGSVALFGTLTNVFGRANVLTFARDPSTEALSALEMRPLAPLVVGLDWSL